MVRVLLRWMRRLVLAAVLVVSTIVLVRAWDSLRGPPLEPWHTVVPHELDASQLDRTDWAGYLATEDAAFRTMAADVIAKVPPEQQLPGNRYFAGSPLHPQRFTQDWNRSFVLQPDGPPRGAVVLLHGLTDSPYSLRHVAQLYRDQGFVALAIRLPGHGTVPAGLTAVTWEDWSAATRLAVREAVRRAGPGTRLHVVGYSNGGALATKYALEALDNTSLPRPDQIVLLSPMVGVTSFARFAGLAGLPAFFPAFAKSAWLSVLPEFNPFKYNSFPVNAARQSHRLTQALQQAVRTRARNGVIDGLAPVLTFQSIVDATVSTAAIVTQLYAQLPANGSEIVIFDVNRTMKLSPLLRESSRNLVARIVPAAPAAFRASVVTNRPDSDEVVASITGPAGAPPREEPLGLTYPRDVYSLSHVALPFPVSDGLYGTQPDPQDDFGIRLGTIAARGETGVLVVDAGTLMRMMSNPFYPYLAARITAVTGR